MVTDIVCREGGTELLTSHVPGDGSPAGFYARRGTTIVLTISAHCYDRASPPRDPSGRPIGRYGAEARRADCPAGRTCAGTDIVELILEPDQIPWGHLDLVDLGAGGYRTLAPGARPQRPQTVGRSSR